MLYSPSVESPANYQSNDQFEDADLAKIIASSPPGKARDAEAELYRRLAPRVRLYGLRHLRDAQAAADLTQHVLLTTIENLRHGRLREPEKLASFVLGTSRMVVRDWRRGKQRQNKLLEQFGREFVSVEKHSIAELDTRQLTGCLQHLLERERTVLVLTFYAERSTQDVAEQFGLSVENVRVIRHRALRRLRECITDERKPA